MLLDYIQVSEVSFLFALRCSLISSHAFHIFSERYQPLCRLYKFGMQITDGIKVPANEETLSRKHCLFPKCFPVWADRKHLLRKRFLLLRNKKCFWLFPETFCFFNKCFPVCTARKQCFSNSVSATMFPRLWGPLKKDGSRENKIAKAARIYKWTAGENEALD